MKGAFNVFITVRFSQILNRVFISDYAFRMSTSKPTKIKNGSIRFCVKIKFHCVDLYQNSEWVVVMDYEIGTTSP